MNKSILLTAFCAFAFGANATVKSGTFTVPENETHVLTSAENVHGQEIVLSAGSTLKLPENAGDFALHPYVRLTGSATIDTGDATSLVMDGGLYAEATTYALTIVGLGEFSFGKDNGGAWGVNVPYPRFDIADVRFPAESAAKITLTDDVASCRLPPCEVEIAEGARIIAMGENGAGIKKFFVENTLTVSGWTLLHGRSDGLSSGKTVKVMSDGAFYLMPRIFKGTWGLDGFGVTVGAGTGAIAETVELCGEGAVFGVRNHGSDCFSSIAVSGTGTVRFIREASVTSATLRMSSIWKPIDIKGPLVIDDGLDVELGTSTTVGSLSISGASVLRGRGTLTVDSLAKDCEARLQNFTRLTVTGASDASSRIVAEEGSIDFDFTNAEEPFPQLAACDGLHVDVRAAPGVSVPVTPMWNPSATNWHAKVKLHFDASDEESLIYYPPDKDGNDVTYTNGFPLLIGIIDQASKVSGNYLYALRSTRGLGNDGKPSATDEHRETCPYLVPGGLNGKNYLCYGAYFGNKISAKYGKYGGTDASTVNEARRTELTASWTDVKTGGKTSLSLQYAIMVFGSQQGGGSALFGCANGAFARGGTSVSSPLVNKAGFEARVDGLDIDPAQPNILNGGWQIVSIDLKGEAVNALGWNTDYVNAGGQNYAEVILFNAKPTEAERCACEQYLAKKWGLAYRDCVTPNVTLDGDVALTLEGEGEIAGTYCGTVEVAEGSTMVLPVHAPVPGEEAVIAENRVAWYDPSCVASVLPPKSAKAFPGEVGILLSRTEDGPVDTSDTYYFGGYCDSEAYSRSPWTNTTARGHGPEMPWLDFRNSPLALPSGGNALRTRKGIGTGSSATATNVNSLPDTREVFMALDTTRGGGNVLGVNATSLGWQDFPPGQRAGDGSDYLVPVWTKNAGAFTNAVARLDDEIFNPWTTGYHGRPEVFSFATVDPVNPSVLALYNVPKDDGKNQCEVIGETIFYSQPLSDENRRNITAYLAYKWFGKTLTGYADVTGATVTGAGTVVSKAVNGVGSPDLSGFTGTLRSLAPALAFTANADGSLTGGIATAGAVDLTYVDSVTVTAAGGTFAPGRYVLASGSSMTYGAATTFAADGAVPEGFRAKFLLEEALVLSVEQKPGMIIILK